MIVESMPMKTIALAFLVAASVLGGSAAHAGPDDAKWVGQCVLDNQAEKAGITVIAKYCTCMNEKMSDNETMSISQWEKINPAEMRACERVAGWR